MRFDFCTCKVSINIEYFNVHTSIYQFNDHCLCLQFSIMSSYIFSPSDRFRQIEVLQQVTTAFSLLVTSGSSHHLRVPPRKDMSLETQEKRRRMGMLLRQASKKSLNQLHRNKSLAVPVPAGNVTPDSQKLPSRLTDTQVLLKEVQPRDLETVSPKTLEKEQGVCSDLQTQSVSWTALEGTFNHVILKDAIPQAPSPFLQKKENPVQANELFVMEEVSVINFSNNTYTQHSLNVLVWF